MLRAWPINLQGARTATTPLASIVITDGSTGGGAWGPAAAKSGQRYEFALLKPDAKTIHAYTEPFVRSDYAIRLLGSIPIETYTGKYPGSSGAVIIRYKEYWGNEAGQNDELLVNGLNVCTATLSLEKAGERLLRLQLGRQTRNDPQGRPDAEQAPLHPGCAGLHPGECHPMRPCRTS